MLEIYVLKCLFTLLQMFAFQFQGHEDETVTFQCDVLVCGEVTSGACFKVRVQRSAVKGEASGVTMTRR